MNYEKTKFSIWNSKLVGDYMFLDMFARCLTASLKTFSQITDSSLNKVIYVHAQVLSTMPVLIDLKQYCLKQTNPHRLT